MEGRKKCQVKVIGINSEFKADAVRLVTTKGRSVRSVAKDLDISKFAPGYTDAPITPIDYKNYSFLDIAYYHSPSLKF